ncbi:hypothetical protein J3E74DRAFT_471544 [Bipolaris maydis]|nr:hypothetical protein J3E74DRAFT_471544 [Bipolaris maydis]
MYTVTAHEMENALDECTKTKTVGGRTVPLRIKDPEHMPLISFPWLFPSELGKIATGGRTSHQPNRTSSQPRQTKHVRPAKSGAEIGAVETAAGTTHYGEVLDLEDLIGLDFSLAAPQASDPVPTPEMSESPNIANDNIGA